MTKVSTESTPLVTDQDLNEINERLKNPESVRSAREKVVFFSQGWAGPEKKLDNFSVVLRRARANRRSINVQATMQLGKPAEVVFFQREAIDLEGKAPDPLLERQILRRESASLELAKAVIAHAGDISAAAGNPLIKIDNQA